MTSTNTSNELARLALRDPDLLRDRSLIAGVWRCADDGSECVVSNPATGARIGSVPDMGGAETPGENFRDELFVGQRGERGVELDFEYQLDAERGEGAGALAGALQTKRRALRLKELARVRLEHGRGERRSPRPRDRGGFGDDLLVAAMHAVEITERHGAAAQGLFV